MQTKSFYHILSFGSNRSSGKQKTRLSDAGLKNKKSPEPLCECFHYRPGLD
ncbi:Uncharacterized protein dnm_021180 [Desulfonema magnum]|uniref:Uncharacterized protein n=1 Tax=Desulfonema magnum TaxID=45655 RepID=A0A975GLZ2_9BACT|nr:Uncharacterized protein dnm_021180 [Desulfonema magnum]